MALKKRTHVSPEFNLASMIDVIFLLLMFFMLSSKLVNTNALNLTLPSSSSKTSTPPNFVEVSIKKTGEIFIGTEAVEKEFLEQKLAAKIEKNKQAAGSSDDYSVIVSPERDCTVQDLVTVMSLAQKMHIKMILNTTESTN